MRKQVSKRLVIDTDVLRRSGGQKARGSAKDCRLFLECVWSLKYCVVMTPEISKEWNKHASTFAQQWRVSMEKRNRMYNIKPIQDRHMCNKILNTARSNKQIKIMKKDFHLLNAALATDETIISCEKKIRKLFARASQKVCEIRKLIWVNPERTVEEQPITWLQNGAPPDLDRQLSNFIPY